MTDASVLYEDDRAGAAYAALDALPRARLNHIVTPLEPMPNLSAHCGGAPLAVKRDDLAPLAMGGNKVRQLEFYFGEAIAQGADTVLITGAVQSNFVRLTAAAARKCGMHCHVQLEERVDDASPQYRNSGNVLLDRLLGATIHPYPAGEDEAGADASLERIAEEVAAAGATPYVIHLGAAHPPLGALGYVDAARELVAQVEASGAGVDRVVLASGSGATHAGMLFGLVLLDAGIRITGSCVRRDAGLQRERIRGHCERIAGLLGVDNPVRDADIELDDRYLAPGYGKAGPETLEAIRRAARDEGLIVDPVYSAKALACAMRRAGENLDAGIVFLHSGGTPAIFGYESIMLAAAAD